MREASANSRLNLKALFPDFQAKSLYAWLGSKVPDQRPARERRITVYSRHPQRYRERQIRVGLALLEKTNLSKGWRTCSGQSPAVQRLGDLPRLLGPATRKTGQIRTYSAIKNGPKEPSLLLVFWAIKLLSFFGRFQLVPEAQIRRAKQREEEG